MKKIAINLLVLLLATTGAFAQGKVFTRDAKVTFFSDAPMEDIEAVNTKGTSVIDESTGAMEFAVLMKGFQFEKALMQEHFNENYVESNTYPKATFKGKITDMSKVNLKKDGTYQVTVKGEMTLHGVTKPMEAPATVTVKNGHITHGDAKFNIRLADYNIKRPDMMTEKIAETVQITVNADYQPLEK